MVVVSPACTHTTFRHVVYMLIDHLWILTLKTDLDNCQHLVTLGTVLGKLVDICAILACENLLDASVDSSSNLLAGC